MQPVGKKVAKAILFTPDLETEEFIEEQAKFTNRSKPAFVIWCMKQTMILHKKEQADAK